MAFYVKQSGHEKMHKILDTTKYYELKKNTRVFFLVLFVIKSFHYEGKVVRNIKYPIFFLKAFVLSS